MNQPLFIDGKAVVFHITIDITKFGLSKEEAQNQDAPEAYAIVEDEKANAGIIVYAKYKNEWLANPWSTRFLIKWLLDNYRFRLKN